MTKKSNNCQKGPKTSKCDSKPQIWEFLALIFKFFIIIWHEKPNYDVLVFMLCFWKVCKSFDFRITAIVFVILPTIRKPIRSSGIYPSVILKSYV